MQKYSGIILSRFKYSDTSLIVRILTKQNGLISGLVRGARKSKKNGFILQPGNIVDFTCRNKPGSELYTINNYLIIHPYSDIPNNIIKSMMIVFLSEVVLKSLAEGYQDESLFHFVLRQFMKLDAEQNMETLKEYHLHFLIGFAAELGFEPQHKFQKGMCFDIHSGVFSFNSTQFDKETSQNFANLLNRNNKNNIPLSKPERQSVLDLLLKYFDKQLSGMGELKSLKVYQAISE